MEIQFLRYFAKLHLYTVVRKETVRAEALGTRASGNIVRVGFGGHHFICVVLNSAVNEFGSVTHVRLLKVVIVFDHVHALRKVLQDFFDCFLLSFSCRRELLCIIYFFYAFAGSDILCIAACTFPGRRLQIFEFRNEPCHASSFLLPLDSIFQREGTVQPLDLLHTFSAQSFQ